MMSNKIETTSTIELIKEMTSLERKIEIELLKYNKIVLELYRRIPILEQQTDIKPKILVKDKIDL